MKLSHYCNRCVNADGEGTVYEIGKRYELSFNNSSIYQFKCDYGHEAVLLFQNPKFEVLAEVAVQALADGYYREAVTSFASSLERVYEYYCQTIVTLKLGYDAFAPIWKPLSLSERQYGMFFGLFALEMGRPPPEFSKTSFRNKVVHAGYIPTEDEAIAFGKEVISLTRELLCPLQERHRDVLSTINVKNRPLVTTSEPVKVVFLLMGHVHNLLDPIAPGVNFDLERAVAKLRESRHRQWFMDILRP